MTRELFWLTWTVILTGLMWVPYILNRCQVRGLGGAMANPARGDKPHAEWANRLMFAHDNAVENLVVFAPLVLILNAIDYSQQMDRAGLRGVFLGPRRASDRLHHGPAGVPHAGLHRRLPRASRARAGDFQDLSDLRVPDAVRHSSCRLRRAGTVPNTGASLRPRLCSRTAPQELRAALRPGNARTCRGAFVA